MRTNIEERACELAEYIIENNATVRAAAKKFGISKSTVHTAVTKQNDFYRRTIPSPIASVIPAPPHKSRPHQRTEPPEWHVGSF